MRFARTLRTAAAVVVCVTVAAGFLAAAGCGGVADSDFRNGLGLLGTPFARGSSGGGSVGPGQTGTTPGSGTGSGSGANVNPCAESQNRKFVTISMRNLSPDFIHYFLVLIAFVDDPATATVEGAVCSDDVPLYTAAGYIQVPAGGTRELGNLCIEGPALYYFHRQGQFRVAGGSLASAIGPAQGASPTYDLVFTASGRQLPVPDLMVFHNPGTTAEARALRFAFMATNPCTPSTTLIADPACEQDAFYYVDQNDLRAGPGLSPDQPFGSAVRFPLQIQGTGCQCGISNDPWAILAPSGRGAATAQCNEFFRGGRIDFAFVRDDTDPPYPQLVWRVSDSSNTRAHNFDPRARIP